MQTPDPRNQEAQPNQMSNMMMPNPCKDGKEEHISLVLLSLSDHILKKPGDEGYIELKPEEYTTAMVLAARYIGHTEKALEEIIKLHDSRLDWIRNVFSQERKTVALIKKIRAACIKWRIIPLHLESKVKQLKQPEPPKPHPKPQVVMNHNHREAFALMWYQCEDKECGHREQIWNSRDGVTPFCTACPRCNGTMQHVDWNLDRYLPDYQPMPGQGFWRDGTVEDAVKSTEARIEHFKTLGRPIPDEHAEKLLSDARNQTGSWQPGWPKLERAPAEVASGAAANG